MGSLHQPYVKVPLKSALYRHAAPVGREVRIQKIILVRGSHLPDFSARAVKPGQLSAADSEACSVSQCLSSGDGRSGPCYVKEILRHKSIEMTMRYSHLSPEHKKSAIDALETALLPKAENEAKQA